MGGALHVIWTWHNGETDLNTWTPSTEWSPSWPRLQRPWGRLQKYCQTPDRRHFLPTLFPQKDGILILFGILAFDLHLRLMQRKGVIPAWVPHKDRLKQSVGQEWWYALRALWLISDRTELIMLTKSGKEDDDEKRWENILLLRNGRHIKFGPSHSPLHSSLLSTWMIPTPHDRLGQVNVCTPSFSMTAVNMMITLPSWPKILINMKHYLFYWKSFLSPINLHCWRHVELLNTTLFMRAPADRSKACVCETIIECSKLIQRWKQMSIMLQAHVAHRVCIRKTVLCSQSSSSSIIPR